MARDEDDDIGDVGDGHGSGKCDWQRCQCCVIGDGIDCEDDCEEDNDDVDDDDDNDGDEDHQHHHYNEIYLKFAKLFIQIVGPKTFNTMHHYNHSHFHCNLKSLSHSVI